MSRKTRREKDDDYPFMPPKRSFKDENEDYPFMPSEPNPKKDVIVKYKIPGSSAIVKFKSFKPSSSLPKLTPVSQFHNPDTLKFSLPSPKLTPVSQFYTPGIDSLNNQNKLQSIFTILPSNKSTGHKKSLGDLQIIGDRRTSNGGRSRSRGRGRGRKTRRRKTHRRKLH